MDIVIDPQRNTIGTSTKYSTSARGHTNSARYRRQSSQSFLQESYSASLDFPTYIPWATLSTDLSDKLKHGSVKINRSNCLEWASPIKEENERVPLLDKKLGTLYKRSNESDEAKTQKGVTDAVIGGISWKVAAFLLVNAALGAGVLNYPSAYARIGGVLIATIIQVFLIAILGATMMILVYSSDLNKDNSYHDVLLSMCGKRAQQLSAISIMLTCYGISVTFLIIIGDQYDRIFTSLATECLWPMDRRFTITATAFVGILPMCYFRRLDFLRYAGTLGVFSMIYVVFLNIYQYYVLRPDSIEIKADSSSTLEIFAIIPVFCFAYQSHEIVIPVYACMQERNVKNFGKAAILALFILAVVYCGAGTYGYLTFGTKVSADIMQLYDANDPVVFVGIIALIIKMITTYPPMAVCGRGALDGLYAEFLKIPAEKYIENEKKRRIIITTLWFTSSLAFAIFTPNISIVIQLLGSLASANVFIFPSLCLISIVNRDDRKLNFWIRMLLFGFAFTLIVVGITILGLVLFQTFLDLRYGEPAVHDVICK